MAQFFVSHTTDFEGTIYNEKRLEEVFQIEYLPQLTFENWKVERSIRYACQNFVQKRKIKNHSLWLGTLHREAIREGYVPDVTIKWVDQRIGYGVFTNRAIKAWEFIGEYTGVLRRRNRIFIDTNDYCFMYPKTGHFFKAFTIDSEKKGNFTRFINHGDNPNLESIAVFTDGYYRIVFRAIKDISAFSELTYDYGDVYWKARKKVTYDS